LLQQIGLFFLLLILSDEIAVHGKFFYHFYGYSKGKGLRIGEEGETNAEKRINLNSNCINP
jgi:hypothetical protein